MTGIALPTASDAALRGALRDGLLLCKLLNILRPGILPKVLTPCPSQATINAVHQILQRSLSLNCGPFGTITQSPLQVWELPKERNVTSEVICINNNVTNFIATLEALDFPRSAIFSLSDLESTGAEDRWGYKPQGHGRKTCSAGPMAAQSESGHT